MSEKENGNKEEIIGVILDKDGNKQFISPKAAKVLHKMIDNTTPGPVQDMMVSTAVETLREMGEITPQSETCVDKCQKCEQIGCPLHPQSIYEGLDQSAPTGPVRKDN